MQKLITLTGIVCSAIAWFLYSAGTVICLIYALYLWGPEGLTLGTALWNAFTTWLLLMVIATFSLIGGTVALSSIGLNFYEQYLKKKPRSLI